MSTGRVFLVAAEASGDALGADLIHALRARAPQLDIAAIGGAAMAAAGAPSRLDISGLSVLGLIDGIKAYGRVVEKADLAAIEILAADPAVCVLIDSWGFTLRVAQRVRRLAPHIKLVKYVGPQVWATRASRAKTLAESVDHLICIHDFEVPYYTPFGLPCTVCGHPAIGRERAGDSSAFRARHNLAADVPVVLVLPGSRPSELKRVGPTLASAAALIARQRPDARVFLLAAPSVAASAAALGAAHGFAVVDDPAEKEDAFAAASVALAASGTVTTEIALQNTPVIVAYKLGWITWALARGLLFKAKFATLMNVAADREVAPEFLQTRMRADLIGAAGLRLVNDSEARAAQVEAQNQALTAMGRGGRPAADIAAETILGLMR